MFFFQSLSHRARRYVPNSCVNRPAGNCKKTSYTEVYDHDKVGIHEVIVHRVLSTPMFNQQTHDHRHTKYAFNLARMVLFLQLCHCLLDKADHDTLPDSVHHVGFTSIVTTAVARS